MSSINLWLLVLFIGSWWVILLGKMSRHSDACVQDWCYWKPLATPSSQYFTEKCLYTPVSRPYEIKQSYGIYTCLVELSALLEIFSCNPYIAGREWQCISLSCLIGSWTQVLALVNFADGKYAQLSLTSVPCIMNNNEFSNEFWMRCIWCVQCGHVHIKSEVLLCFLCNVDGCYQASKIM